MAKVTLNTTKAVQQINNLIIAVKELRAANQNATGQMAKDLDYLETELKQVAAAGQTTRAKFLEIEAAAKRLNVTNKETVGAYRKLQIEYRAAVRHAKDMATMYGKMDQRARVAAAAAKRLGDRLNAIDSTTKKVSKSMKIFNATMSKIAAGIAMFVGVQTFINLAQNIFNVVKQMDALSFAMQAVITDEFELAQTTQWLQEITSAYGADLVATTNRYIKFRAAAGQANLTMKETQDIFETMTKVSGVLGLSTDELSGIYLALEQMISKGKVTTEELRRQLGERLPGAVDILAKSMGVTTEQLSQMMKKGEVITKDVLPKFAQEVEKTFSLDKISKVETLVASQQRLSNSWMNLIATINGSDGVISTVLMEFFEDVAAILNQINKLNRSDTQWFDIAQAQGYEEALAGIAKEAQNIAEANNLLKLTDEQNRELAAKNLSNYGKAFNEAEKQVNKLRSRIKDLQSTTKDKAYYDRVIEIKKEYGKRNITVEELLKLEKEELTNALKRQGYAYGQIKAMQSLFKIKKDIADLEAGEPLEVFGKNSEASFEKSIKAIKDQMRPLDMLSEKYKALKFQLDLITDIYKMFKGELKEATDVLDEHEQVVANSEPAYEKQIASLEKLQKKLPVGSGLWNTYQSMIEMLRITLKGLKGELDELGDETLTPGEKFRKEMANVKEFTDALGAFGDALFQRKLENINAEIEAETDKYDKLMALAEDDAQQKKRLEYEKQQTIGKLEKERLKKEQQQARYRKAQALVDIAINTAVSISAATKESLIFGLAAIPVLAALGAIQAATVMAQPIPQYAEGLDEAKKDHVAMINDGGKKEFIERGGKIFSTNAKNAVIQLKKGDTVYKDEADMIKNLRMLNLTNEGQSLDSLNNIGEILETGIDRGFKKAKINNNIKLNGFDYARAAYRDRLAKWN